MKKERFMLFGFIALLWMLGVGFPIPSNAGVNVGITIPLPGLMIPAPPAMVIVPGTNVYYPPDVGADIFFYHDHWYRPYGGHWFIAAGYNGPWGAIGIGRVPRPLLSIPPNFRRAAPGYERVPYGVMTKNWRTWERNRHWERGRGREERRYR